MELSEASQPVRDIATFDRVVDVNLEYDADITFTHISSTGDITPFPVGPRKTILKATGVKECTLSLKSPVLNPISGLDVNFSSTFREVSAWYTPLLDGKPCSGEGIISSANGTCNCSSRLIA
jgi:hypothetical protein